MDAAPASGENLQITILDLPNLDTSWIVGMNHSDMISQLNSMIADVDAAIAAAAADATADAATADAATDDTTDAATADTTDAATDDTTDAATDDATADATAPVVIERQNQIGARSARFRNEIWEHNFSILQDFVATHNRLPISKESHCGINIGKWVVQQRSARNNTVGHMMNSEREAKLNSITGWKWCIRPQVSDWDHKFSLLEEYIEEFNELPEYEENYKNVSLGAWVAYQRESFWLTTVGKITQSHKDELENLSIWSWNETISDEKWNKNYQILKNFLEEFKRLPTYQETYQNLKLGVWILRQRSLYQQIKLRPEYIKKLEELDGWNWDISHADTIWNSKLEYLKEYVDINGEIPKIGSIYRGVKIGKWVSDQRHAINSNGVRKLTPERKRLLEEVRGWSWNPTEDRWMSSFNRLRRYVNEFGKIPLARYCMYEDVNLGEWVTYQRTSQKLSKRHKDLLKTIPGWIW